MMGLQRTERMDNDERGFDLIRHRVAYSLSRRALLIVLFLSSALRRPPPHERSIGREAFQKVLCFGRGNLNDTKKNSFQKFACFEILWRLLLRESLSPQTVVASALTERHKPGFSAMDGGRYEVC